MFGFDSEMDEIPLAEGLHIRRFQADEKEYLWNAGFVNLSGSTSISQYAAARFVLHYRWPRGLGGQAALAYQCHVLSNYLETIRR